MALTTTLITNKNRPKIKVVINLEVNIFARDIGRVNSILIVPVENSLDTILAAVITVNNVTNVSILLEKDIKLARLPSF
ncbi:hypothetical protein D3C79_892490 [compost metagenome]